jgi:four helix bundle protein
MSLKPKHYELEAWKEAMRLARQIYEITQSMPESERFGLYSQMRRSAVSIASNIAEGAGRGTKLEFRRFLQIARGSLTELDTQVWIASDMKLIERTPQLTERLALVFRLLNGLITPKSPKSKS